jgi:3',5'-cyclic AMP phosphodiesterase CpdA
VKNRLLSLSFILLFCYSCTTKDFSPNTSASTNTIFPSCSFLVITDTHYLSTSLYDKGEAFQRHLLWKKGNLTEFGTEILDAFKQSARQEKPDFIIVTGDLTNNGEKLSHIDLTHYFASIEEDGTEVFVIPGNHDVDFPYAMGFSGTRSFPVESITAGGFLTLYDDFGYNQALSRDNWSLSYAVEPSPGITLLGLDSCVYGEDYGYIKTETMGWLEQELKRAATKKNSVILFMHHSLLEHYPGQSHEKEMKLKNSKELLSLLNRYNVSIVLTGHYHAQDIAMGVNKNNTLYDIQTGAMTTWPFSYRKISCQEEKITIEGKSLDVPALDDKGWMLSYESIYRFTNMFLSRYNVKEEDRKKIADYAAQVLLRHYGGDEDKSPLPEPPEGLSLWGRLALIVGKDYYKGRLEDLPPDDLNIEINTLTGDWTPLP